MFNISAQSNIIKSIFSLLLLAFFMNSCQQVSNSNKNVSSKENSEFKLLRFEQELFKSDPNKMDTTLKHLSDEYKSFFEVYFLQIMNFGKLNSPGFTAIVKDYTQNSDFRMLLSDCDSVYNEAKIKELEGNLHEVLDKYQELYPMDTMPKVCTFISGFGNGIVTTDGYIGIGLDLFMGADYRFYPSLDLPDYLTRRYTPNHVLPMFAKGLASYKYPFENDKPLLIDVMLNEGKMLYFMDQLLGDVHDTLKIGYTSNQYQWCKENEANIYQLLIQENLYSSDFLKYRKYTEEAPFTVNLTNESAPRIAWYCGWQIIKNFMDNNPSYTLDQLMKEKDSQKIIQLSKYKP